jgi:hypothetical protein
LIVARAQLGTYLSRKPVFPEHIFDSTAGRCKSHRKPDKLLNNAGRPGAMRCTGFFHWNKWPEKNILT